jgi:hypothetical protein
VLNIDHNRSHTVHCCGRGGEGGAAPHIAEPPGLPLGMARQLPSSETFRQAAKLFTETTQDMCHAAHTLISCIYNARANACNH